MSARLFTASTYSAAFARVPSTCDATPKTFGDASSIHFTDCGREFANRQSLSVRFAPLKNRWEGESTRAKTESISSSIDSFAAFIHFMRCAMGCRISGPRSAPNSQPDGLGRANQPGSDQATANPLLDDLAMRRGSETAVIPPACIPGLRPATAQGLLCGEDPLAFGHRWIGCPARSRRRELSALIDIKMRSTSKRSAARREAPRLRASRISSMIRSCSVEPSSGRPKR
jgi:hypothetical protein